MSRTRYLAFVACMLAGCGHLQSGGGYVFNPAVGERVPGVEVTMFCDKLRWIHGTTHVRKVTVFTDDKGQYQFTDSEVFGCDFGGLRARKPGHVVIDLWYPPGCPFWLGDSRWIAPRICMVEKTQLAATRISYVRDQMSRLKDGFIHRHHGRNDPDLKDPSDPTFDNRKFPMTVGQKLSPYLQVMSMFYETSALAEEPGLREVVKEEFCPVLRDMYGVLDEEERAYARSQRLEIKLEGIGRTWMTFDYRKEVEPVCDRNDATGWNYGRAYEHYARLMQSQVGRHSEDGHTYRSIYLMRRAGVSKLANGNIEEKYPHGRDKKCPTFIEIDAGSKKIVGWRREGSDDDCGVLPF